MASYSHVVCMRLLLIWFYVSQIGLTFCFAVCSFPIRNGDVKYLLRVMFIAFWILSLFFHLEASCLFFIIYPITCHVTGMREGIRNISFSIIPTQKKGEQKTLYETEWIHFIPWNVLFIDFFCCIFSRRTM